MTRSPIFCLTLLLNALLCVPCMLEANPMPLPMVGGAVAAKSPHETIRMEAEEVAIRLGQGSYTVAGVYHMVNSGETTTEWVGFPRGLERNRMGEAEFPDFIQFHAWVGGKKVIFSKEGGQWLAGQVTFPGHSTTVIRVVYEANYTISMGPGAAGYAEYIVGTGSLWKDSIGKAIFTVDGSEIGGTKNFDAEFTSAQGYKLRTGRAIRFDVRDFKPDREATLHIQINSRRKAAAE